MFYYCADWECFLITYTVYYFPEYLYKKKKNTMKGSLKPKALLLQISAWLYQTKSARKMMFIFGLQSHQARIALKSAINDSQWNRFF